MWSVSCSPQMRASFHSTKEGFKGAGLFWAGYMLYAGFHSTKEGFKELHPSHAR